MASAFTWCDLWIYLYIYISSLLPLHVPVACLTVSHFLLWEKLLGEELTPVSAETSTLGCCLVMAHTHTLVEPREKILWLCFPNVETFWSCPRPPCFGAAALEKGGRALPSLCESHSFSTCLTPVPLARYRITSLNLFHDNRHGDFNAERKVWRIWALMR